MWEALSSTFFNVCGVFAEAGDLGVDDACDNAHIDADYGLANEASRIVPPSDLEPNDRFANVHLPIPMLLL